MKEKGRSCYLQANHVLGICKARNGTRGWPLLALRIVPLRALQQEGLKQYAVPLVVPSRLPFCVQAQEGSTNNTSKLCANRVTSECCVMQSKFNHSCQTGRVPF